jgi:hypothetical protein
MLLNAKEKRDLARIARSEEVDSVHTRAAGRLAACGPLFTATIAATARNREDRRVLWDQANKDRKAWGKFRELCRSEPMSSSHQVLANYSVKTFCEGSLTAALQRAQNCNQPCIGCNSVPLALRNHTSHGEESRMITGGHPGRYRSTFPF